MNTLEWGKRTYVMGIVNVTPDSFSGDGVLDSEAAVQQGIEMEKEGADMLDIGGESTRPGSIPVSLDEELARVIPVVARLAKSVRIPLSIDTYKAEVAREAIGAGASIVNDVWGGMMEPDILKVAAAHNSHLVLMHNRSKPNDAAQEARLGGRYIHVEYQDLIGEIKTGLVVLAENAIAAGVSRDRILIDPGIGFGKTVEQNLEIIRRLDEFKSLGYPVLVGPSRKSFVGYTLNLAPEDRLEGTAAAVALSVAKGADIVRVHDVKAIRRVASFVDAVVRR
jgi:dihydropteroate synthase